MNLFRTKRVSQEPSATSHRNNTLQHFLGNQLSCSRWQGQNKCCFGVQDCGRPARSSSLAPRHGVTNFSRSFGECGRNPSFRSLLHSASGPGLQLCYKSGFHGLANNHRPWRIPWRIPQRPQFRPQHQNATQKKNNDRTLESGQSVAPSTN